MSFEAAFWMCFGACLIGAALAIDYGPRVTRLVVARVRGARDGD